MTRNEVLSDYAAENGIIQSPGKFEGEMIYVPALWDLVLEGCSDAEFCDCNELCDCTSAEIIEIDEDFAAEFPEAGDARRFRLWEDGYGFVHCEDVE